MKLFKRLGIDLGTANSIVYVAGQGLFSMSQPWWRWQWTTEPWSRSEMKLKKCSAGLREILLRPGRCATGDCRLCGHRGDAEIFHPQGHG